MKTTEELLLDLGTKGGAIVSSEACSVMEIAHAQAAGRFAVNAQGYGYLRRTREWLDLQKKRELLHPNR